MNGGFDYGNARVRAMRSRMLSRDTYGDLVTATTIEQILGVLDDTDYAEDVEAALTRYRGPERYDRALSAHLTRTLSSVRSFYDGRPRGDVDLALLHHDLDNLVTIVRGQAALPGSAETASLLVAAGTLDHAALEELAQQPGLRETVELMVTWGVPSQATARGLLHVWPEYERTRNVAVLEAALATAVAKHLTDSLDPRQHHLATMLESWIDTINLITSLRLRASRIDREPMPAAVEPLPGGRIPADILSAAITATATDAAAMLEGSAPIPGWDVALDAWATHERIDVLSDDLTAARTLWATSLFYRGDPLSVDVPLAFIAAKENEVRNLRLIGQGCTHGVAPEDIESRLVIP